MPIVRNMQRLALILATLFLVLQGSFLKAEGASDLKVKFDASNILNDTMASHGQLLTNESLKLDVHDILNVLTYKGERHFYFRGESILLTNTDKTPLDFHIVSDKPIIILLVCALISLLGSMVAGSYLVHTRNIDTLLFFLFTLFLGLHNATTYYNNYLGYLFYYLTTSFSVKSVNQKYLRKLAIVDGAFLLGWLYAVVRQDVDFLYSLGNFNYISAVLLIVFSVDLLIKRTNPFLAVNFIASSLFNIMLSVVNSNLLVLGFSAYCLYIVVTAYRLISSSVKNEKSAIENLGIVEQKKQEVEEKNQLLETKQSQLVKSQGELVSLNMHLEDKVREKTKDINALLNNISSGILSIEQDLRVSKDYSAYLPSILGKKDIANSNFRTLFLNEVYESDDKKDACLQSLLSCLGENVINFEVNNANFLGEVAYQDKILKCDWSFSTDKDDRIEKILLVLNDITKEKEQERLLREQEIYFTKVKELVDAKEAKSNGFFATSRPLMDRIISILNNAYLTLSDVESVYVGYHTVKGAARTLGFKSLSNAIHQSESVINKIKSEHKKAEGALRVDSLALKENYYAVLDEYNLYWNINKNELNRSDNYSNISIEKNFIEDHYAVLRETYSHLYDNDKIDKEFVSQKIFEQKNKILSLIQVSLENIFDTYKEQILGVAKELKKSKPMFQFKIQDCRLSEGNKNLLDNIFTHLIRNIMDHGIESDHERAKKKKTEYGTIFIDAKVDKQTQQIRIQVKDDGRGLAIEKLRSLGISSQRLTAKSSIQEIAESIFMSGVSTAETITDISGRGVGMGAVKQFLREHGGDINIVLEKPKDTDGEYYEFHFDLAIPWESDEAIKQEARSA